MPISAGRAPRRGRRAVLLIAVAGLTGAVAVPTLTTAQPGGISGQRAEVARLQAQLDAANLEAERATEAYNGARYELDMARQRIATNTDRIDNAQKRLTVARDRLAKRLRQIYAQPTPSLVQVMVDSGSVTNAVDSAQILERMGQQDGNVVTGIRGDLDQLAQARVELVKDRAQAKVQVGRAQEHRQQVLAALDRRQQLLDGAKGELRRLLAAEQARQAAIARAAAQQAVAAQQAAASTPSASSGSTPQQSPATYAPTGSGGGNSAAVSVAMRYLGVPYVWGGASPSGFDCSGLASYAYAQIGKSVPHYTGAIWAAFPRVADGDLQPGDLVFFHASLSHMGIYIGGGQFIHAPHTGDVVKISSLAERGSSYVGAVRP